MSGKSITIVDYGIGNLYSVKRAFEVCGAEDIIISGDPATILTAERVVLPGVGSFADGMRGLRECGLDLAIKEFGKSGRPLLGICLGMQLFASTGREFGDWEGLDLIPGSVEEIPRQSGTGQPLKLPFIGWASLDQPQGVSWDDSVLSGCDQTDYIYLVHSFQFKPAATDDLLATYRRNDGQITAAVRRGNITGLQFHPEKSGAVGMGVLTSFLKQS